ncbi:MAG: HlyD family efflux transporter periplasmic adaptor subunit [Planctomycetes bacterium]|nr:HlyD family efflux transporter periplasmic adaptor subunit [Planctomycetota bacterium]
MQAVLLTTLLALSQAQPPASQVARAEFAILTLVDEADIPAENPGVLRLIGAKEGDTIQEGAPVAEIDDREALAKLRAAQADLAAAEEEAKSDVRVRAAQAAHRVAEAELAQARATRARAPNSVTDTEVRRLELSAERYELETEVAQKDLLVAQITKEAKQALVDQARLAVDKLKILSPLDGMVVQVYKNRGEWVAPGDPIARVVRMDRLRVQGDVNASVYSPQELADKPVTVQVELSRGRTVKLEGKVTFVSPIVEGKNFQVWAEVDNREENGFWLLRPGLAADMAIHLE